MNENATAILVHLTIQRFPLSKANQWRAQTEAGALQLRKKVSRIEPLTIGHGVDARPIRTDLETHGLTLNLCRAKLDAGDLSCRVGHLKANLRAGIATQESHAFRQILAFERDVADSLYDHAG
jgi:hypothetical protein